MPEADPVTGAMLALGEPAPSRSEVRKLKAVAWDAAGFHEDPQTAVRLLLDWRRIGDLERRLRRSSVTPDQRIRVMARSMASWEDAQQNDDVIAYREVELGGEHIPIGAVHNWIGRKESRRDRSARHWGWLEFPTPQGLRQIRTARDGQLYRLRETSRRIADIYRWEPAWAVSFLLSGSVAIVQQVTTSTRRTRSGPRMLLECDPTMSQAEVIKAFDEQRRRLAARGAPQQESFRMYAEWIGSGRPNYEIFAGRWNVENGTLYSSSNCRERIVRVQRFLDH